MLQKFAICKHHEFVTVTYLLEDMLPLVFFQNNIFCSGDPLEYENLMNQMAVLFICRWRRHYNKPLLSFLSDMEYHKNVPARILVKEIGVFQRNYREKSRNIPFYFIRAQYGT